MPTPSKSLTDDLVGLVTAFGGPLPLSKGLTELYQDLIAAITNFGNPSGYIPGIINDGVTDNYATLTNYITSFTGQYGAGGQLTLQLPPGKIALSQSLVPPANVYVTGSGNEQRAPNWTTTGMGTTIVPSPSYVGTGTGQLVQLNNHNSGLVNLNVDGGTTVDPFMVNAIDCSIYSTSLYGGTAFCLNSTATAQRFNIGGANVNVSIRPSSGVATGLVTLNALGLDWECVGTIRFTGGTKNLLGGGSQWVGVHFTNATTGSPNIVDGGGQIVTGCYIDSCGPTSPALISHNSGGTTSSYTGNRYFQNTTSVTGIPVFLENGGSFSTGLNVTGGWVLVTPVSSSFTAIMHNAGPGDLVTGVMFNPNNATAEFFDSTYPSSSWSNVQAGNAVQNFPFAFNQFNVNNWYGPPTNGTVTITQSQMNAVPLWIGVTGKQISNWGINITSPGSTGSVVRLGLYEDNGSGSPATAPLVLDAGTVSGTSTGSVSLLNDLPNVAPGLYWLVACGQGAPTTQPTLVAADVSSSPIPVSGSINAGTARIAGYTSAATVTGALPSTFTGAGVTAHLAGAVALTQIN